MVRSNMERIEALEAGPGEGRQKINGLEDSIQRILAESMASFQKTLAEKLAAKTTEEAKKNQEANSAANHHLEDRLDKFQSDLQGRMAANRTTPTAEQEQNEEAVGGLMEKLIVDDGGNLQRREAATELADELQKMVNAAARVVQPAYWFLGPAKAEKIEPVFVLVKGGGEFGSKCEPDPDFLGPPPWPNSFPGCFKELKGKQVQNGLDLGLRGPLQLSNQPLTPFTEIEREIGPVFGSLEYGPKKDELGRIVYHLYEAATSGVCCRRKHNTEGSFVLTFLPPARPSPQPPDANCRVVSGKEHASSDDPGDLRVLWLALSFSFKHHLGGKAARNGSECVGMAIQASEVQDGFS